MTAHTPIASRMEAGAARPAPIPSKAAPQPYKPSREHHVDYHGRMGSAPQSILAIAREQVEQELGPRPSITSVGSWTGYRTNSDADEGAAFASHFARLNAMRRWDRAVSDRCKLLGMAPTLIGDA